MIDYYYDIIQKHLRSLLCFLHLLDEGVRRGVIPELGAVLVHVHELAGQLLQPRLPRDLGHQGVAGDGAAAEAEDLLFILVKCILGEQILFLNN